jgi:hypothetical protein
MDGGIFGRISEKTLLQVSADNLLNYWGLMFQRIGTGKVFPGIKISLGETINVPQV